MQQHTKKTGKFIPFPFFRMSLPLLLFALIVNSCSISYSLEGGSINYDITKTISIASFPNRTPFYSQMTQVFDQALRKRFIEQTRLTEVSSNPDIEIEGEITNYSVTSTAVTGTDAYASMSKLTISVQLTYINNKESNKDVNQSFSAFREFENTRSIDEVEDELVRQIVDDIIDQIYNATVAKW